MSDNKILTAIYDAIDLINAQNEEFLIEKSPETILFGRGGRLDSLGLVNLVVAIEQNIEDAFDTSIVLANENAMAKKNSPFRTVSALAGYIAELLEEKPNV
jgi:acyl carrier protein|tara:strand:+ start:14336 stop:14638 length:303 start_codon:yes stop_codon:yes gene_type:complete